MQKIKFLSLLFIIAVSIFYRVQGGKNETDSPTSTSSFRSVLPLTTYSSPFPHPRSEKDLQKRYAEIKKHQDLMDEAINKDGLYEFLSVLNALQKTSLSIEATDPNINEHLWGYVLIRALTGDRKTIVTHIQKNSDVLMVARRDALELLRGPKASGSKSDIATTKSISDLIEKITQL